MAQYALKVLIDIEARDDIEARQRAAELIRQAQPGLLGVREIVLHAQADRKSIRMNPDGSFQGQWNRGGPGAIPHRVGP
jgi:hypothetical protein